jgi:non-heme chloroperoxidase
MLGSSWAATRAAIASAFLMTGTFVPTVQLADTSSHRVRLVTVEPGVSLEVLDWGGSGDPVLLLAGLGNTGHVFDAFAPALVPGHHVYALTRRGFGASSQPAEGYALTDLVRDIARVMDAVGADRVHLVGHSIAGDEMTRFARVFPDRLRSLIYLDATVDRIGARRVEQTFPPAPQLPGPTPEDRASPEAVQRYVTRTLVALPMGEILAQRVFDADGKYLRGVTPAAVLTAVAGMVEHPDYSGIHVPVLAVNAVAETPGQLITQYSMANDEARAVFDRIFEITRPFAEAQRAAFRTALPKAEVIDIPGANHYLFISNRDQVLSAIRTFLSTTSRH